MKKEMKRKKIEEEEKNLGGFKEYNLCKFARKMFP
jgi:hypothetical protein